MEYSVCVSVESSQYPHKTYIALKTLKNGVLKWNIVFVWLLSRLNTHKNRIFHHKSLKKLCLLMEYRVCGSLESDSIPTQIEYSIVKRENNAILQ